MSTAAAGAGIGLGVQALGGLFNSSEGPSIGIPGDTADLRKLLADYFGSTVAGTPGQPNSEIADLVNNALQRFLTPDFLGSINYDPMERLAQLDAARRPAFENQLQDTLGGITSRYGSTGNRFSSDLFRILGNSSADAEAQYSANLTNLLPQLDQIATSRLALGPSLVSGIGDFNLRDFQARLAPLGLATQFGTAGVGALPAYQDNRLGGAISGGGSALSSYALLQGLGSDGVFNPQTPLFD